MALKVLDAGECLMLSGDSRDEVDGALAKYVGRGAKIVTQAVAVGSHWTAACTLPVRPSESDISHRMKLSELRESSFNRRVEPEIEDGCSTKNVGLKCIVTGPSMQRVLLRVQHMTRSGAILVGTIVQHGGNWLAIVDTANASNSLGDKDPYSW
jgi:hypothetical protein